MPGAPNPCPVCSEPFHPTQGPPGAALELLCRSPLKGASPLVHHVLPGQLTPAPGPSNLYPHLPPSLGLKGCPALQATALLARNVSPR